MYDESADELALWPAVHGTWKKLLTKYNFPGFVSRRKSLEETLTSLDIYERAMLRERLNTRKEDIARSKRVQRESSRARREAVSAPSVTVAAPADECRKPRSEPCAKRELYVNFRDIGLSTIIAPEGYAAYQCRGHCESPLSQEQKPTNHATIQVSFPSLL
jgi:hypothetical protein